MGKNGPRNGRRTGPRGAASGDEIPASRPRPGTENRREEAERIRRNEVSRALRKMDLSPAGEAAVEGLARSLVGRLLRGPIPEALAHRGDGHA